MQRGDTVKYFGFGPLRFALSLMTLIVVLLSSLSGMETAYTGWAAIPTIIAPVLVPLLSFVLMLDALMSTVFRSQAEGGERKRYGRAIVLDLALLLVLLASWTPFFLRLIG